MTAPSPALDPSVSDVALARAVIDGAGEGAEAALVARFSRRVFLYGMRHLGDEARADDLVQEVMARVLTRLRAGEVREPERIGSFILGTARFTARDMFRGERRAREVARAAASERDEVTDPVDPSDHGRLASALASLSERERAVIVLTFVEDRSGAEIAESLGLEAGNVRVIRHRAIARLGRLMGVDELTEGGGER